MKVGVQKILINVLQKFAPNSVMKFLYLFHVSRINGDMQFRTFEVQLLRTKSHVFLLVFEYFCVKHAEMSRKFT